MSLGIDSSLETNMAKLLHIQSSPRGSRSASLAVAEHFVAVYRAAHPGDTVETLDLWQTDLPEINGATLGAIYAGKRGQAQLPEHLKVWHAIVRLADHFKSADYYLLSLPMWNFGIPYRLKHYIDLLVQRGLTFSVTPEEGYKGLVTGKPLVAVYARGGTYRPGSGAESWDHQSTYLRHLLGFIGFTNIREIFVEPTEASPASRVEAVAAAKLLAAAVAAPVLRSSVMDAELGAATGCL
jgi:FMN-dependent NADH-azoreductase